VKFSSSKIPALPRPRLLAGSLLFYLHETPIQHADDGKFAAEFAAGVLKATFKVATCPRMSL